MVKALVLLLSLCLSLTASLSPIDLPALQALYNSANGGSWNTVWNFSNDLCTNSAATVQCYSDGRVRRLYLSNMGMTGSLPTEIGLLTKLDTLVLNGNSIGGTLPTEIGLLNNTGTLVLSFNQFTGPIPSEIGNVKIAQKMLFENNQLTGTIPASIAQHPLANEMRFANNYLSGSIPALWGPNVVRILLDNNNFTGTIPTQIFTSPVLNALRMQNNKLTGSIPTEIGLATSLTEFYCTWNFISGSLPTELGTATALQRLWFYGNSISGPIPTQVGKMINLVQFKGWSNQLTNSIPSQFGSITTLQQLEIYNNFLSGSIPTELGNSPLTSLKLQSNSLIGHVPGPVTRLVSLVSLFLNNNCLSPRESYATVPLNDYATYNTSSSCPLQGPYPQNALAQAPALSYEFYPTALLFDSSISNIALNDSGTASLTSLSLGQYGNPFNGAIQVTPAANYALYSGTRVSILGSFTIEILAIFPNLTSTGNLFALSTVTTGSSSSIRAQINTDGSISVFRSTNIPAFNSTAGTIKANRMHHVLITWDSGSKILYMYVDGVGTNNAILSTTFTGNFYLLLGNNLHVVIDEVDVYRSLFGSSIVANRVSSLAWCPVGSCLTSCYPSYSGSTCT